MLSANVCNVSVDQAARNRPLPAHVGSPGEYVYVCLILIITYYLTYIYMYICVYIYAVWFWGCDSERRHQGGPREAPAPGFQVAKYTYIFIYIHIYTCAYMNPYSDMYYVLCWCIFNLYLGRWRPSARRTTGSTLVQATPRTPRRCTDSPAPSITATTVALVLLLVLPRKGRPWSRTWPRTAA